MGQCPLKISKTEEIVGANGVSPASCCWASKTTLSHVHPRLFPQTQFLKTLFASVILQFNFTSKSDNCRCKTSVPSGMCPRTCAPQASRSLKILSRHSIWSVSGGVCLGVAVLIKSTSFLTELLLKTDESMSLPTRAQSVSSISSHRCWSNYFAYFLIFLSFEYLSLYPNFFMHRRFLRIYLAPRVR
jgi:hypothetical protein